MDYWLIEGEKRPLTVAHNLTAAWMPCWYELCKEIVQGVCGLT